MKFDFISSYFIAGKLCKGCFAWDLSYATSDKMFLKLGSEENLLTIIVLPAVHSFYSNLCLEK